jgi:transcriptional regulator with XRE-family HTH domain
MKGATSIQERLWELRKDKGLNLEELSKLTGISKSALGSYEKEDFKEINHGNLITLADFYGVSVDYLLCRIENREQINTPLTELHLNDEMVALLKGTDAPALHSWRYAGKFSARAGTPNR